MSEEKQAQGMDPRGDVFADLASIIYAAEAPVSGSYVDQSRALASMLASVMTNGMMNASVLDIGCGFGTTTMAIMRHLPSRIVAADASAQHIKLLQLVLHRGDDIAAFLDGLGARPVLGEFFEPTVRFLTQMRREYGESLFAELGGETHPLITSSFDIVESAQRVSPFGAIVSNNFLHWPINQRRKEIGFDRAWLEAVQPLRDVLADDGFVAFLEPKDFVYYHSPSYLESVCQRRTMVNHPAIAAMHRAMNGLLLSKYGITRETLKTSPLFEYESMPRLFHEAGFVLLTNTLFEATLPVDPLDFALVRVPMHLGQITIPLEEKIAIGREARDLLRNTLSSSELTQPIRSQYFVWIARKR